MNNLTLALSFTVSLNLIILPILGDVDNTTIRAMFVCLFVFFAHSGYYGTIHHNAVQMGICGKKGTESERVQEWAALAVSSKEKPREASIHAEQSTG